MKYKIYNLSNPSIFTDILLGKAIKKFFEDVIEWANLDNFFILKIQVIYIDDSTMDITDYWYVPSFYTTELFYWELNHSDLINLFAFNSDKDVKSIVFEYSKIKIK